MDYLARVEIHEIDLSKVPRELPNSIPALFYGAALKGKRTIEKYYNLQKFITDYGTKTKASLSAFQYGYFTLSPIYFRRVIHPALLDKQITDKVGNFKSTEISTDSVRSSQLEISSRTISVEDVIDTTTGATISLDEDVIIDKSSGLLFDFDLHTFWENEGYPYDFYKLGIVIPLAPDQDATIDTTTSTGSTGNAIFEMKAKIYDLETTDKKAFTILYNKLKEYKEYQKAYTPANISYVKILEMQLDELASFYTKNYSGLKVQDAVIRFTIPLNLNNHYDSSSDTTVEVFIDSTKRKEFSLSISSDFDVTQSKSASYMATYKFVSQFINELFNVEWEYYTPNFIEFLFKHPNYKGRIALKDLRSEDDINDSDTWDDYSRFFDSTSQEILISPILQAIQEDYNSGEILNPNIDFYILMVPEETISSSSAEIFAYLMPIINERGDFIFIGSLDKLDLTDPELSASNLVSAIPGSSGDYYLSYSAITYPREYIYGSEYAFYGSGLNLAIAIGRLGFNNLYLAPAGTTYGSLAFNTLEEEVLAKAADKLYKYQINPIITPTTGGSTHVIWGNKTLYLSANPTQTSALTSLNVRLGLLRFKREVKQIIANYPFTVTTHSLLFTRFQNEMQPIINRGTGKIFQEIRLEDITTETDIQNNTVVFQITMVPIPAIEVIKVNIVVTPTGVSISEFLGA